MPFKKSLLLITFSLLLASCNSSNDSISSPAQTPPVVVNGVIDLEGSLLVTEILDESRYNYVQVQNLTGVHTIIAHSKFKSAQNNFIFIDPDLNASHCNNGVRVPTVFTLIDSSGNALEAPVRQRFTVLPENEYTLVSKFDLTNCTGAFVYWFGLRAGK